MIRNSNAAGRSGIDELLDFKRTPRTRTPECVAADDATLSKYASQDVVELWRLVLLHSRVDPDWWSDYRDCKRFVRVNQRYGIRRTIQQMIAPNEEPSKEQKLCDNLTQAREAIRLAAISAEWHLASDEALLCKLPIEQFAEWASQVELPVIGPWPSRAQVAGGSDDAGLLLSLPFLTPWLRVLQEIAWHFAQQAGKDAMAWPTNPEVIAWAMARFDVDRRIPAAIATMLRREELKPGRRPGTGKGSTVSGSDE